MPSKHHFASTKIMEVIKKTSEIHNKTGALILENGEVLWGYGLGVEKSVIGELCFNTSQTGYQEALSDPSYTKQIITFTFPHIGIVGANSEDKESNKIYADACIINQPIDFYFKELFFTHTRRGI